MAPGSSLKNRHRRTPATRQQQHKSVSSSMALISPPSLILRRKSTIFLATLILSVFAVIYITSNRLRRRIGLEDDVLSAKICSIEVVNEFPHDPKAFTQGLLYGGNDTLFESTGLYGQSSVRKVVLHTGKVEDLQRMDNSYFGEGLTLLGDRLIQVTWLRKTGFIYDQHNLSKFEKFTHQMRDGWGLATDGEILFGSDGSSTLYKLSSHTFEVIGKVTVKYNNYEVHNVNELEYVNGEVWANIWSTDCIARISPNDGVVLGWILLPNLRNELLQAGNGDIDVLNGIAWDSEKKRIFVTGKQWPKLYEIKLHPIRGPFYGSIEQLCLRRQAFKFADP